MVGVTGRLSRVAGLALIAVIVTGCGAAEKPAPTTRPDPAAEPTRAPAEIVRIVGESIDQLYCGEDPKPDWCDALSVADDGGYDIGVDGTMLAIGTHTLSAKLAKDLCASVASAHFDENAVDLGYRSVVVVGPGQKVLAECRVAQ